VSIRRPKDHRARDRRRRPRQISAKPRRRSTISFNCRALLDDFGSRSFTHRHDSRRGRRRCARTTKESPRYRDATPAVRPTRGQGGRRKWTLSIMWIDKYVFHRMTCAGFEARQYSAGRGHDDRPRRRLAVAASLLVQCVRSCGRKGSAAASRSQPSAGRGLSYTVSREQFFHGSLPPVSRYNTRTVTTENAGIPAGNRANGGSRGAVRRIPRDLNEAHEEAGLNTKSKRVMLRQSLESSLQQRAAAVIINQSTWDVVVMHGFSTGPVRPASTGKPDSFRNTGTLLEQTIHSAAQGPPLSVRKKLVTARPQYPDAGSVQASDRDAAGRLHCGDAARVRAQKGTHAASRRGATRGCARFTRWPQQTRRICGGPDQSLGARIV